MTNVISKYLFPNTQYIPADKIYGRIDASNVFVSTLLSLTLVVIGLFSFIYSSLIFKAPKVTVATTIIYVICFVVSCTMFIIDFLYHKKILHGHKVITVAVDIFALICFSSGIVLSYLGHVNGRQTLVFFSMLVLFPVLFYIHPVTVISGVLAVSFIFFPIAVFHGMTLSTAVYVFVFEVILSVITSIRYVDRIRSSSVENELVQTSEKFMKLSYTDALTGLKNRYALERDYESNVNQSLFVMMMDIDDFKFFNDNFGHNVGDEILKKVGDALIYAFTDKCCYRFGGDEFVVIDNEWDQKHFKNKISEWKSKCNGITVNGQKLRFTCSCGYIYGTQESVDGVKHMVQLADVKLYNAKRRGKNCEVGSSYDDAVLESTSSFYFVKNVSGTEEDELTGFPNMMYFRNKAWLVINNDMEHVNGNSDDPIVFVYFDIENFRDFNERKGFSEGDNLLRSLARTINMYFADRLKARFADDHFFVLTYGKNIEEKIQKIHEEIKAQWGESVKAGVYVYKSPGQDIGIACDRAKYACDSIKNKYDAIYRFYDDYLQKKQEKRMYILNHFEDAINKEWIQVYYQPIVSVDTRKVTDFEALTRWDDPKYGCIMPNEFISILEEAHLINKLDIYMLETIGKDFAFCKERNYSAVPISLNVSRIDFLLCDMRKEIERVTKYYGLPKNCLSIEIKENAFVENQEILQKGVEELRGSGFNVWMDNFGNSYSSLNVIEEYGFDVIKFDMRFLHSITDNNKLSSMFSHMICIARELGVRTLTEGVETEEQLDFLRSIGCEKAQGYLFSRPIPFKDMLSMLESST